MAKTRKTIDRDVVVREANRMLALDNITEGERRVLRFLAERILMDGDSYRGFQFLNDDNTDDLSGVISTTNRVRFY